VNRPNASRRELDSVVANIELTLNSIIQGVALFFLADAALAVLSSRHWDRCLYVAAGLCLIFIFWLRSIIDTLTLIKWPFDCWHNFLYIACVIGEVILFSRLNSPNPPLAWFQVSVAYAGVVWLLFIYNMRLIHARVRELSNDAERAVYTRARADQLLNIWLLIPLYFLFNLGCAVVISIWPHLFLDRGGHIWLISWQLLSFMGDLAYVAWYFKTIAPLVLRSRQSEEN
jgi:hypothetical protein